MLGGSSGINFMAYVRPSVEDIDSWASQAPGWSWATLEPYFRKIESLLPEDSDTQRPEYFVRDPKNHGLSGPVQVSWPPSTLDIEPAIAKAMRDSAALFPNKDPYDGDHLGFSQYLMSVDRRAGNVKRSYAATGYLQPCLSRPNLRILTEATASCILLDAETTGAKGVRFTYKNAEYEVYSKREVIIASSTIQSPQLLELSGIGNPDILQAAGITCLVDLPEVGENLQEHPMSAVTYELAKSPANVTLDSLFSDPEIFGEQMKRLQVTQDGMLANLTGLIGFTSYASLVSEERLHSTSTEIMSRRQHFKEGYRLKQCERHLRLLQDSQAPSIEIIGMPCHFDLAAGYQNQSRLVTGPPSGANDCYTMLVSPMYNASRGSTHIVPSRGPGVPLHKQSPRIDLDFFAHPADEDVLAAGITAVDRAFRSESLDGRTLRRVIPPPEIDLEDEQQIRNYVKQNSMLLNHNLGTCAMGRVVDERLLVKGVIGLRVVDCSVIPDQISANPMATVYALAERAADLVREDLYR